MDTIRIVPMFISANITKYVVMCEGLILKTCDNEIEAKAWALTLVSTMENNSEGFCYLH